MQGWSGAQETLSAAEPKTLSNSKHDNLTGSPELWGNATAVGEPHTIIATQLLSSVFHLALIGQVHDTKSVKSGTNIDVASMHDSRHYQITFACQTLHDQGFQTDPMYVKTCKVKLIAMSDSVATADRE